MNPIYVKAFFNSLVLGLVASIIAGVVGVSAGLGLVRGKFGGKEYISGLFRAPLQVPTLVTGVIFLQFYYMLANLMGVQLIETFTGLVIAHLVITFPYTVGAVVAIVENFPPNLEEAAFSLGASRFSTLIRVTLPIIKPGIFAGMIIAFVMSFSNVSVSIFLSGSRFETLPVSVFGAMAFDYDPRLLSISTLVVIFSALLIYFVQKITGLDTIVQTRSRD
jgi:putative spermidine/putrescine transport system permease protein